MASTYETDVVAWANEQAALLRSGNLSAIDIEHIAEEIEDVGKSGGGHANCGICWCAKTTWLAARM